MKQIIIHPYGPPGCGKGRVASATIALLKKIIPDGNIAYISMGDLIRAEIKAGTPLGKQIEHLVNSGGLVDDQTINKIAAKALNGPEQVKLIDGFPRTQEQFDFLKTILNKEETIFFTLFRDTPVEIILERVELRRVCEDCNSTHSKLDGSCPYCGGRSLVRPDDANIHKRLQEFKEKTLPLWDRMTELGSTQRFTTEEADEIASTVVKLLFEE